MASDVPTLYLLHGWAVDEQNQLKWAHLREELAQKGIKTVFVGLPGLSSALEEVWHVDDYIKWLEAQLAGKKPIALLGHSFGGQLAIRYTAQHPDQISQLILIDAAGIRDKSLKAVTKRTIFWLIAKIGGTFFQSLALRKLLYKLAREKDYYEAPEQLRQTMANVIKEEVIADATQIKTPTLIIWGNQDQVTPVQNAKQYQQLIHHSQLTLINGARHSPHFTHPDQVVEIITKFMKGARLND